MPIPMLEKVFQECNEKGIYVNLKNHFIENDTPVNEELKSKYKGIITVPDHQQLKSIQDDIHNEGSSSVEYIYSGNVFELVTSIFKKHLFVIKIVSNTIHVIIDKHNVSVDFMNEIDNHEESLDTVETDSNNCSSDEDDTICPPGCTCVNCLSEEEEL